MNEHDEKEKIENTNHDQETSNENQEISKQKKKEKMTEEELNDLMNQVDKLIDELSDEYNLDKDKIKVMPVPTPKLTALAFLLTCITILVFNTICIIAFGAVFNWAEWVKIWYLVFFVLFFSGYEIILKASTIPLLKMKKKNLIVMNIVKCIPFVLAALVCAIWPIWIKITNYYLYVLICCLTYAIRNFYVMYFAEKNLNHLMNQVAKKKIKKSIKKVTTKSKKKGTKIDKNKINEDLKKVEKGEK